MDFVLFCFVLFCLELFVCLFVCFSFYVVGLSDLFVFGLFFNVFYYFCCCCFIVCHRPVSSVSKVAILSGLSSIDCPFGFL